MRGLPPAVKIQQSGTDQLMLRLRFGWRAKGHARARMTNLMNIELESMAIEMPRVEGHPNREPFRGVLTLVDVVSDRAPAGARGHRVVLARAAADAALASLLGMGLDYAPSLDRHDARRKIGVITRAEIVGKQLELGGYLFAKDFPEIVREIGRGGEPGRH